MNPIDQMIRALRLLACTTGLDPAGETLFRALAETSAELRREVAAVTGNVRR